MEQVELAPIILFAYNRPWHTEQTLNALTLNHLSEKSTLYINVDGPKENATVEQIEKIKLVREIVGKKKWCKNVIIKVAEKNVSCRKSVIMEVTRLLSENESLIILEDDVVTSPYFLTYMNKALNYYKERRSVFSISAHCPPPEKVIIPEDYEYDVYASPRIFNWGWGTWADRWHQVDWDKSFIPEFAKKNTRSKLFTGEVKT